MHDLIRIEDEAIRAYLLFAWMRFIYKAMMGVVFFGIIAWHCASVSCKRVLALRVRR